VAESGHSWIDTEDALRKFVSGIERKIDAGEVDACFIDTEADSLHHYQEKLCLIQLGVGGQFALIDSIAIKEMRPLIDALDRLEIWMHGADYDLTMFRRTYDWVPRVVRDTQIAARLAGHRQFGLAALVEQHFGVTMSKASQKADWSRRPLPEKMLTYAVDDVRWLPPLVENLKEELENMNRWSWFEQSCASLRADVLARPERDREEAWRVSGSGSLRPKGLALLRAIWLWRDRMAAERDVPPFRILNNQQMLGMAEEFESSDRVSISERWRGSWRKTFLETVDAVRATNEADWPQRPRKKGRRTTEEDRNRIEKLCKTRDRIAEKLGIDTALLGSRAVIEDLVLDRENGNEDHLMPWQREALGEALEQVSSP
jgi:ribonuclease D